MKLKQRILLVGVVITWFLVSMLFVTYYYVQNYHSIITYAPTDHEDKVQRMKLRLAEKDVLRPRNRKLKKDSVSMTTSSSMYDSDRAVEVEMNDTEYEDMLKRRKNFIQ